MQYCPALSLHIFMPGVFTKSQPNLGTQALPHIFCLPSDLQAAFCMLAVMGGSGTFSFHVEL